MERGKAMSIDICLIAILLLSCIIGAYKGFVKTVTSFMSWFVCIVIGFVFFDNLKEYISSKIAIKEFFFQRIRAAIESNYLTEVTIPTAADNQTIDGSNFVENIPSLFSDLFSIVLPDQVGDSFSTTKGEILARIIEETAMSATEIVTSVLAFLLIAIGLKVASALLIFLFSKDNNEGVTGFIDGVLGFLLGALRGFVLIMIFLAVLVPLTPLLGDDFSSFISEAMKGSMAAKVLYDNNFILLILSQI